MAARKPNEQLFRLLADQNAKRIFPRYTRLAFTNAEVSAFRKMIELQKAIDQAAEKSYRATGRLDVKRINVEVEKRQQYLQEHPIDLRRYELFLLHLKGRKIRNAKADPAKEYGLDEHVYSMHINPPILFCM